MNGHSNKLEVAQIMALSEHERAAAIMHFIYIQTINRPDVDWETGLAARWVELDERAKAFNRAVLHTWTRYPELLSSWAETLEAMTDRVQASETIASVGRRLADPEIQKRHPSAE